MLGRDQETENGGSAPLFKAVPDAAVYFFKIVTFKKAQFYMVSLHNNLKMMYDTITELRKSYHRHSGYCTNQAQNHPYDSLLQWPSNGYFQKLKPDAALLKEALNPYPNLAASTVADQVFGAQARGQRTSLQHQSNILYERAFLHAKHLKEIERRLMQCHEKISILKMHFPIDAGRTQQNLERLVLQLEQERRTEEINFWKDTSEIRDKLFADAGEYGATKRRKHMLYGVEG